MAFSGSDSEYELDEILETRKRGRATEYKVRWKNFGEEEDTWETERSLMRTAPQAVEAFKKKGALKKTPTRSRQVKKQENDAVVVQRGSGRVSRANTTTTITTTTSISKLESFSDASDAEGGLVRRSSRTVTEKSSSSSGATSSRKTTTTTTAVSAGKSILARCCGCLSIATIYSELPFIIYLACMLLIAATFVHERL